MGETRGFFGWVETGSHQRSTRMVCSGEIDAAIDLLVLTVELRDHPALRDQMKVIDVLAQDTAGRRSQPVAGRAEGRREGRTARDG